MHYDFTTYVELDNKYIIIRKTPSNLTKKITRKSFSFNKAEDALIYFNNIKEKIKKNGYEVLEDEKYCFRVRHESSILLGLKKPNLKAMAAKKR